MREIFTTDKAPKPIGPYSQAVRAGNILFISGQTPIDPASGQMVAGGIEVQTERVFENLKGILAAAGLSLESVVKVSVFLKDMNEFAAMNGVYVKYFPASPPARSTIEAARLPRDARVEIDMIAAFE